MSSSQSTVLLQPRPYANDAGRLLLLPLLPSKKPMKKLPQEVWERIFTFALDDERQALGLANALMTVCKGFSEMVLPLVYSVAPLHSVGSLEKFHERLHTAEQKWDSIRRIPYSAPGRWVHVLDLSNITFTSRLQATQLDSLLTRLFHLTPFLSELIMNPSFVMSHAALAALARRDGARHLVALHGIGYVPSMMAEATTEDDILVQLLRHCVNLEVLEVVGQGPDPTEAEFLSDLPTAQLPETFTPLSLSRLHTLSLLSMYTSPLLLALLESPLPALRKLTITPYDDIPYPTSVVTSFITTHGMNLRSLSLFTPKSWPSRLHPSPRDILSHTPILRHLSLETPLPDLLPPVREASMGPHPLQILSIARPTPNFWGVLLPLLPHLPYLSIVRARDVRWLRKGMTSRAQEAGIQGELREWQRRLGRRRIRVLDADWQGDN